ncbi:right-handed parallel beta-helix repeat-containing protein, partial [Bacteroidota bacterium]
MLRIKFIPVLLAFFSVIHSQNVNEFYGGIIEIEPGETIQQYVDSTPAGTAFLLKAGKHIDQSVTPKNGNIFLGEQGTVMQGKPGIMYAFEGRANDVVIDGIEITGYGPDKLPASKGSYHGAITSSSIGDLRKKGQSARWVVRNCTVHHNILGGIFLGDGGQIINNHVHHNGQIGVKLYWANSGLIEGNEIAFNNNLDEDISTLGHFDRYWEAGGT